VQQLFGGEGVGVDGEKKVIDGLATYYQKICTLGPSSRAYMDAFLAELAKNYNAEKLACIRLIHLTDLSKEEFGMKFRCDLRAAEL
jgi:hypothetical protein